MIIKLGVIIALLVLLAFLLNCLITYKKVESFSIKDHNFLFKEINGARIAYLKKGNGFPLLLIHGFMSSALCFKDIIDDLSIHNTVYALDVPGFGLSDKNPELDFRRGSMAKIIYEFMQSEGVESFNLLGHSMGGEISIHMAINYPKAINKLILVSSAGCQEIKVMPKCIITRAKLCNFLISNIFMTYYFQKISFEATVIDRKKYNQSIFNDIFTISKTNIPPETLRKLTKQADDCNIVPKLRFIKNATMIIWGDKDNVVPVKFAHKIHKLIRGSRLEIIQSCKHNPYIEKRGAFLDILEKFLSDDI